MPSEKTNKTFLDILKYHAEVIPNKIAYRYISSEQELPEEISFSELEKETFQTAYQLIEKLNPKKKERPRAIILCEPGLSYITAFLGSLAANVISIPLYPPRNEGDIQRLMSILGDAEPTAFLVNAKYMEQIKKLLIKINSTKKIKIIAIDDKKISQPVIETAKLRENDIAFLQYTSGSTGSPKGIMVTHKNLVVNSAAITKKFNNTGETIGVSWLPPYHDMGLIGGILQSLYVGTESVLMSPIYFLENPIRWLQAISTYRGGVSGGSDFAYHYCVEKISDRACEVAKLDLSSWKVAYIGSETVHESTMKQFSEKFKKFGFKSEACYPCFGLAEATLLVAGKAHEKPTVNSFDEKQLELKKVYPLTTPKSGKRIVSCGSVVPGHHLIIVNPDTMKKCSSNEIGEIWFSGGSVTQGYWKDKEKTEEIFHAKLPNDPRQYLRTGDLGFLYNKELYFAGRIKDLIIIRGRNLYATDIEYTAYNSHPLLQKQGCAAFSVEIAGEERLVIVCELKEVKNQESNLALVATEIRTSIAETYGIQPFAVLLVETKTLPRTPSGKLIRYACRYAYLRQNLSVLYFSEKEKIQVKTDSVKSEKKIPASVSKEKADELIAWLRDYASKRINSRLFDERRCIPPYIFMDLANKGLMGMYAPQKYGGLNLRYVDGMRIMEQLAAIDITLTVSVGYQNALGVRPLLRHGDPAIIEKLVPTLVSGKQFCAFAITELGSGGQSGPTITEAVPQGKGWILNGYKRWNFSGWANLMHVFTHLKDKGEIKPTVFTISRDMPGVSTGPEALTMGFRGIQQTSLTMDNVYIDSSAILGEIGKGVEIVDDSLALSRFGMSLISLGVMKRAFQLIHRFASRRKVYTGKLINNPVILEKMSMLAAEIAAHEAITQRVLKLLDEDLYPPLEIFMAVKVSSTEAGFEASDLLMQLLGGRGYMENNYAPQLMRDIRALRITEGPNEALTVYIGRNIIESNHVQEFLSSHFNSSGIANKITESAKEIYSFNKKHSTSGMQASIQTQSMVGLLTIKGILLAAFELQYQETPNDFNKKVLEYLTMEFKEFRSQCLSINSQKIIYQNKKEIDSLVEIYLSAIGDIEPLCPDEDLEIDPLIQKQQPAIDEQFYKETTKKRKFIPSKITKEELISWIKNWVSEYCNVPPKEIDENVSLFSYGLDSIKVTDLTSKLQDFINCSLEPTILWEYNTIENLSDYILEKVSSEKSKEKYHKKIPAAPHDYNQLSIEQERMWVSEQLIKESSVNNIHRTIYIKGPLNIRHLEKSINNIIQENNILRSSYPSHGQPEIHINKYQFQLKILDHTSDRKEKNKKLSSISKDLIDAPFDLTQAPLFRIQLVKFDKNHHALIMVFHHIIVDVISITLIFEEIVRRYKAYTHQNPIPRQETAQFINYSYWQRQQIKEGKHEDLKEFWVNELKGAPALLEMPLDKERTTIPNYQGSFEAFKFDKEKLQSIKNYAKDHNTTPFVVLLAVFNALLYLFSRQRDLVVGVPTAGRYYPELESMIGFLSYPLPFRAKIDPKNSFLNFLSEINKVSINAMKHSQITLSEIITAINPPRDVSYNPIFQVVFSYMADQLNPRLADGTKFIPSMKESRPPLGLDLFLGLYESANGIEGAISYNTKIFYKETIQTLINGYINLVLQCLSHHDIKINELKITEVPISPKAEKYKIVISSTFVAEPLKKTFDFWMDKLNIPMELKFAPFNQVFQELLTPDSLLLNNNKGCNVILIRLTDWLQKNKMVSQTEMTAIANDFISALKHGVAKSTMPIIVCICPINLDTITNSDYAKKLKSWEDKLIQSLNEINEIHLVTEKDILSYYPISQPIFDSISDEIASIPYSKHFYCAAATLLARYIYSINMLPKKVIIMDCDNTLWKGICGEDSLEKIKITYPYQVLQYFLIRMQTKGKLICLCTKNNESDVFRVFDNHPDMLLKSDHITAHKINWSPKTENILLLAKELDLGTDSFIFIDDNPVECAEIKANLPEVLTLQLPIDEYEIPTFLSHIWDFDTWRVSEEDKFRTLFYKTNIKRKKLRQKSPSLEKFIESLDLKINIKAMNEKNIDRVSQLYLRTNQFNANPVRRLPADIKEHQQQGFKYHVVTVNDRFGDYGIVGVIAHCLTKNKCDVDTFMVSCRVLGRGVERRMIKFIIDLAQKNDLDTINIKYTPTEKNIPVYLFFEKIIEECDSGSLNKQKFSFQASDFKNLLLIPKKEENIEKSKTPFKASNKEEQEKYSTQTEKITSKYNTIDKLFNKIYPRPKPVKPSFKKAADSVENGLLNLYRSLLKITDIDPHADFFQLGGTSFKAVSLLKMIKDEFDVQLSYFEFASAGSIEKLSKLIDSKISDTTVKFETFEENISNDIYLHPSSNLTLEFEEGFCDNPTQVLITGSTGHLGAYLLHDLIEKTSAKIFCIVRANNLESAQKKIINNQKKYNLSLKNFDKRIVIVLGDLNEPYLGIPSLEYQYLENHIDSIYHCAADVNFSYPYLQLRRTNVDATRDIIDFAFSQRTKTLHFISTTAIFDSPVLEPEKTIPEKHLSQKQAIPVGGYAQSKWVAEQLVSLAMKKGLPTTIFRPGAISAAPDSPKLVSKDLLTQTLIASQKMQKAPQGKGFVDFVSVDYAAKAISLISRNVGASGKVFHLTHHKPVSIQKLVDEINLLGIEVKCVTYKQWLNSLKEFSQKTKNENLRSLLPLMTDPNPDTNIPWLEMILNRPRFLCTQAIKLISNKNISLPPLPQLVMKYFKD